ncbi:MAG: DUF29 family protein [Spirulina sp.]
MEELLELQDLLRANRVTEALLLVEEMAEMGKDDKLNRIFSFGVILLMHLMQQAAEQRSTRSWEVSIFNAVKQIQRTNQRRKAGGTYLSLGELRETLEDAYSSALRQAALEAFEGRYGAAELGQWVNPQLIVDQALALILADASSLPLED